MDGHASRVGRASRIGLLVALLAPGCTRLNAAFDDGEDSTGGGVTGMDSLPATTVSTTRAGSASDGPGATGDGVTSIADTDSTSADPSGQPTTSGETDPKFDIGGRRCAVEPGAPCDAYASDCPEGQSCKAYEPDGPGSPFETRCFDHGETPVLQACGPACSGDLEFTCQAFHVCDQFSSVDFENGLCRPLCLGTPAAPGCADGLCFQYASPTGDQLGVCRGDCNPTAKGMGCGDGDACVVREDAPTPTCVALTSVGVNDDCAESECTEGSICIAAANLQGCNEGWCCAEVCDPPDQECPEGGSCVSLEEIGGPRVDMGYCNPP